MFYNERKQRMLEYIRQKPAVTVTELSELFGVSVVTIRKDLNELSREGEIERTHGGAVVVDMSRHEEIEDEKESVNRDKKREIAEKAIGFVEEGNCLYIDAGSTTMELSRMIVERKIQGLTIVTHAFNIADIFRENTDIELLFIGGQYRRGILSCVGPYTTSIMSQIYADKLFFGINGLSLQAGLTTPNQYEAQVKQCMIRQSRENFLLADSSKFGNVRLAKVADIKEIDNLITDGDFSEEVLKRIRELGVKVY